MEVEEDDLKRDSTGVQKHILLNFDFHSTHSQFEHFKIDTETVWRIVNLTTPIKGIIFQHRQSLRPLVIFCYEPGVLDNVEQRYVVYSQSSHSNNSALSLYEVDASFATYKMAQFLTCLDELYSKFMTPLDPDFSEEVNNNFLLTIGCNVQSGSDGSTRKILKAKRKTDVDKK
jgi:hypothetical protein